MPIGKFVAVLFVVQVTPSSKLYCEATVVIVILPKSLQLVGSTELYNGYSLKKDTMLIGVI